MATKKTHRSRFATVSTRLIGLAVLLLSVLPGSNQYVRGQSTQGEPVARLVSSGRSMLSSSSPVLDKFQTSVVLSSMSASAGNMPSFAEATPIERRAFELINSIRVKSGIRALGWDPELCRIARAHSQNMALGRFFSHISPSGLSPKDRVLEAGVQPFRVLAENIAYNQGYDDPGAFAVERWMVSTGHRENILSKEFQASAIGVFVNSDGSVYLTQLFILR